MNNICSQCCIAAGSAENKNLVIQVDFKGNTVQESVVNIPPQIKAEPIDYTPENVYIEASNVKSEGVFKTEEVLSCTICGIYVRDERELQQHTLVHNTDLTIPSNVSIKGLFKQHACYTCDKQFTCKAALKRHIMIHTGLSQFSNTTKPYNCIYR